LIFLELGYSKSVSAVDLREPRVVISLAPDKSDRRQRRFEV
jgi:hypothetical protein